MEVFKKTEKPKQERLSKDENKLESSYGLPVPERVKRLILEKYNFTSLEDFYTLSTAAKEEILSSALLPDRNNKTYYEQSEVEPELYKKSWDQVCANLGLTNMEVFGLEDDIENKTEYINLFQVYDDPHREFYRKQELEKIKSDLKEDKDGFDYSKLALALVGKEGFSQISDWYNLSFEEKKNLMENAGYKVSFDNDVKAGHIRFGYELLGMHSKKSGFWAALDDQIKDSWFRTEEDKRRAEEAIYDRKIVVMSGWNFLLPVMPKIPQTVEQREWFKESRNLEGDKDTESSKGINLVDLPEYQTETMKKERSEEVEPLSAFNDEEWLEMNSRYVNGAPLNAKEIVEALKVFGFKDFSDYYTLDKRSKYEFLYAIGAFEQEGVKGRGPLEGTWQAKFSFAAKVTEEYMDYLYNLYISHINIPKESIDGSKSTRLFAQHLSEILNTTREHGKEVINNEILEDAPDVVQMNEDEKIEFFARILDKNISIYSLFKINDKKRENIENILKVFNADEINALRNNIQEELLKWDRGGFDESEREFDKKILSLKESSEWRSNIITLRESLIDQFVDCVYQEINKKFEIDKLLTEIEISRATSEDIFSFNLIDGPEDLKKKYSELMQKFISLYGKVCDDFEKDKLPIWFLRRKFHKDIGSFIKSINNDIRKRIENSMN